MTDQIDLKNTVEELAGIIVNLNAEMIMLKARVEEMQDQLDAVYIKPNIVGHKQETT